MSTLSHQKLYRRRRDGLCGGKMKLIFPSATFFLSTWFPKGPAARSFVPCLDEPSYKAIWTVSVTHPSELVALSNGAPDSTTYLGNNLVKTTFKPSPKISSYLLGLTIGPYASIQKTTDDGVEVRVWAEVGLEKYGYVALNATVGTLNYLGKYLGLSYAELHDKLDLVLNPEWNGFGTENFGVIIGNANVLLYKETVHDLAHKRNAYRKAAHEVAHQWFGNTVSFKFFNYGFVSEGFASFFETEVVNSVLGWGEAETVHNLEAGLHLDENAKDLDTVITADNKVHDTFNWTKQQIYTKAQGILHSLKAVVGEDAFKEALQRYIRKFKWASVDDQDLWSVFQELADANNIKDWNNQPLSIKKFMDFYTRQVSYPVTVLQLDGNTATVVENVNLHNETDLPPSDVTYTWHTPIVSSKGKVNWAEVGAKIENYEPVGYQSYTRVIYENGDEEKLNHLYNSGSEIQRAKLISDYFNLFKSTRFSGRVGFENLLNLLKNLAIEESPIVWSYGAEALTYILEKSKVNKARLEQAKKFVSSLFNGRTGTDEAGQWRERLPHILNVLAVRINDTAFNKSAKEEFEKFVTKCLHNVENALDCRQTPPEHRVAVFASALGAIENTKELQSLRDFAGGLKNRVFARKIRQLLADAVAHSHLSTNNVFFVTTADVLINDPEEEVARFFDIKSSFDDTQNELAKWVIDHGWKFVDTPHFKSILKALVKDWASKEKLDQFDNIRWPAKSDPNLLRTARSAILKNIKWEEDYGAKLSAWLSSYGH
ncbi:unnamed protein product [Bursaphelenchus xylophilus]|uniref:Aminopeptidase n=1 Tax=Bursaphelenchus xylophilus TaxID=6326 RepID=A0A811LT23_BURXY|nr:unnamed protein product [Bursaphelenchus xylophilus]CAG9125994.1 unnamed protein product [Bursaphelenchus xylophilus]